jgi:hypothetical protein
MQPLPYTGDVTKVVRLYVIFASSVKRFGSFLLASQACASQGDLFFFANQV